MSRRKYKQMKELSKESANRVEVGAEDAGQRLDNYLMRLLKGVPKSHIYRILRSGEVRVNSGRAGPDYRVKPGDRLRIPPIRVAKPAAKPPVRATFEPEVLYEDESLLVINKPAGVAVHGGSGVSHGIIEQLRAMRPAARFLELVHRLDRETSGILMLAKKRSALTALHSEIRDGRVAKHYLALVLGKWTNRRQSVKLPLERRVLPSGERRVRVAPDGMASHTIVMLRQHFPEFSLLDAELKTGRTHQIRVHLAHLGFPIAGDDKYGDFAANRALAKRGLKRMFLHASRLEFTHPVSSTPITIEAPLPPDLAGFVAALEAGTTEEA